MHVVSSLDGFIAKQDNSVSWMDSSGDVYERGVTDDDPEGIQSIDCYVLGSRTYEHALELGWPYGILQRSSRQVENCRARGRACSSTQEVKRLVGEILVPRYRNIWLVGGAMLAKSFLELGLVDEIRLMIAPVILGDGLHLFGDSGTEQKWCLKNAVAHKNGFVELHAPINRPLKAVTSGALLTTDVKN
jgi:dihydrofolate reductase